MPPVVVLLEGASDAAVVEVLWAARGRRTRDPAAAHEVELRDMRGITNVGRQLDELAGRATVLGLCDAPEERFVLRGLRRQGYAVADRADLARLGFHVCDRDLEDELIRALGPDRVQVVLEELGELERFRAFQRQPQWRGRDVGDQLHRFAGTASGRKLLLARRLAEELTDRSPLTSPVPCPTPSPVPRPLAALVADIERRVTA
ncbi:MAG TPA: hypothetical protein VHW64_13225 [Nocardioides sp.]|jgi:hypothetical protein|uniref:hypothetical protein n=1 Tax=Nocardioides sp. TaxID=35761 RepID=UPI002E348F9C|nr:hypothetical protein [Nocardioides sp.]HEX3931662.1 hypothetical protein [Nocardioides sp.]